jgi:hypothetical protein
VCKCNVVFDALEFIQSLECDSDNHKFPILSGSISHILSTAYMKYAIRQTRRRY